MLRLGKYCLIKTFELFWKLCQNRPTNRPTWKLYNLFVWLKGICIIRPGTDVLIGQSSIEIWTSPDSKFFQIWTKGWAKKTSKSFYKFFCQNLQFWIWKGLFFCLPPMAICYQRPPLTKIRPHLKAVFHQRSTPIKVQLPTRVS